MTDLFRKYLLADHSTRVQAVKLDQAWQTGLAHQHYPASVEKLLGELVSAAVLLASNIKFDGSLVLQLQGDGPVALVVVECTTDLSVRATVSLREGHAVPEDGSLQSLLNANGNGRFIVVLDPDREKTNMQPYQGVVPLEGDTVAAVLESYMRDSEQLDTRLWLASSRHCSAGLLLQRLPRHGGAEHPDGAAADDTWQRVSHLASTVKYDELLDLGIDELVRRLFWQEDLIAYEPQEIRWHCPCTRERVGNMLRTLGREEIEDLLSERESIEVLCNFCGKPYHFDAVDCAELFVDGASASSEGKPSIH
ncbi:Hsp33 family molecular chaperone HslO [Parapusillimonas granuli]|uniref:Hsp33 family molecular chaperone HslO n=1 Tax=Parapusillimonas granuli TaxID=380911 RepID=A0A853FXL8_9BURK|nr:Hsp33 family molecular chaperone HslO [Parapusillimonas granuli]MBB5213584.1 molecular chaperone Hsp33 [Parapusillimonas granuli]MEB2398677.1 Hsp33 family molecular chaperone HslO [Alcaligenaceae bacterium]NYT48422.1 Hsp33 family molecular chaperone HslO [Parapusillimonas granuli]